MLETFIGGAWGIRASVFWQVGACDQSAGASGVQSKNSPRLINICLNSPRGTLMVGRLNSFNMHLETHHLLPPLYYYDGDDDDNYHHHYNYY